jgi:lauroyl/myristoyl acyltransferase
MNSLIYWLARLALALIQALPLRLVARLGRAAGGVAFLFGGRYRRLAIESIALCFPEKSALEVQETARENFRRIFENGLSAIKTTAMSQAEMRPHFDIVGTEKILQHQKDAGPQSRVIAIGHFGNFELYAHFGQFVPGFKCAATYRGLKQSALDRVLQYVRSHSDCRFFERRSDIAELKAAMNGTGLLLGLLADQHGVTGMRLPFFGRECSTSIAPAVLALRYHCPLHTAICYRVGLACWRIEVGDEIPTHLDGQPRSVADITQEVNREFEKAIRRDPANWFWVHRRWKSPGRTVKRVRNGKTTKVHRPV